MSKEIEKMTAIYEKHKNTMYAVALKILKNQPPFLGAVGT